jgi:hypothetical protein
MCSWKDVSVDLVNSPLTLNSGECAGGQMVGEVTHKTIKKIMEY